jgi:hypothetical protein
MSITPIASAGDFEAALLHESQEALCRLVGPTLYTLLHSDDCDQVQFHTSQAFDLFLIQLLEVVTDRPVPTTVASYRDMSFLPALEWLCARHQKECGSVKLTPAVQALRAWLDKEIGFGFWCSGVDLNLTLRVPRQRLIDLGGNLAKHSLLRIEKLLEKLDRDCKAVGHIFSTPELGEILMTMEEPLRDRLNAYGTYVIEMIGAVLVALNELLHKRFLTNPTNDCRRVTPTAGVTAPLFLMLYTRALMKGNRNHESRYFVGHVPRTSAYLKQLE